MRAILDRLTALGYDPIIFEARRSPDRQAWLYGYGRTHHKTAKPITWSRYSRHLPGKAVDIISKSRRWSWPQFFSQLHRTGHLYRLDPIPDEACHLQWDG